MRSRVQGDKVKESWCFTHLLLSGLLQYLFYRLRRRSMTGNGVTRHGLFSLGCKGHELSRGALGWLLWWKPPNRETCGHTRATDALQPLTAGMSKGHRNVQSHTCSHTCSQAQGLHTQMSLCVGLACSDIPAGGGHTQSHIHGPEHAQQNTGTDALTPSPSLVPDIERRKILLPQRSPCAVPFFFPFLLFS